MKSSILITLIFLSINLYSQIDWDLFERGNNLFNQDKFSDAIKIFSELIDSDSTESACYYNRGLCYYKLSMYDNAFKDFNRAVTDFKSDSALYNLISGCYMAFSKWEKAIYYMKHALKLGYPADFLVYENIGSCYYFANELDSAKKYLKKSILLDTNHRQAYTNLAFSYLEENPNKSCYYFTKAFEIDSLDDISINNLGYSHFLCGNRDDAIKYYNKALKLNPDNAYIYRNIGYYYMESKDKQNACLYLNYALEKNFIYDWGESHIIELLNYCEK